MITGQEIYLIGQTSINEMLLSKYYIRFRNCQPQSLYISVSSKSFLNLTFAVKYFKKKTPNDILMKHFFLGNTQDKMNAFDGNKTDFFVKIYTH